VAKLQVKELPNHPQRKAEINTRFAGKTISRVEIASLDYWIFHFTDGSQVTVETQAMGMGITGLDVA